MNKLIKILMVGGMLLAGAFGLKAQPGGFGGQMPDPAQIAKMRADQMKESVKLTDAQYVKVEALFKEEMEAMMKRMEDGSMMNGDFEAMRKDMEKRREEQQKKLKAILTEEQFKKWTEEEQARRAAFGGGPGGPGPR